MFSPNSSPTSSGWLLVICLVHIDIIDFHSWRLSPYTHPHLLQYNSVARRKPKQQKHLHSSVVYVETRIGRRWARIASVCCWQRSFWGVCLLPLVLFSSLIVVVVGFGFYEIECLTRFIFLAVIRWARRWMGFGRPAFLSILLNGDEGRPEFISWLHFSQLHRQAAFPG